MNYVMYEYIGTYGYSSKSVALRLLIKQFCGVGTVLITIKPYNNIDDGSITFKVIDFSDKTNDNKVSYC